MSNFDVSAAVPLFARENPERFLAFHDSLASFELEEVATQAGKTVSEELPHYHDKVSNPSSALKSGTANCIARSLAFCGLTSTVSTLETGLVVVASETSRSAHAMSILIDPTTSKGIVAEHATVKVPKHDIEGNIVIGYETNIRLLRTPEEAEDNSLIGGAKKAFDFCSKDPVDTMIELDATGDDEWSLYRPEEQRYTRVTVYGFFSSAMANVANYYSHGIRSDASALFIAAMRTYSSKHRTEVQ